MTITARAALAEMLSAALLLALVTVIYLAAFGISGVGPGEPPGVAAILLATVVVALVVRPAHQRLRSDLRRRLLVPTLPPVEVLRRLSQATADRSEAVGSGLPRQLVTVLYTALQPARIELWIVVEGEPGLAAWLPESAGSDPLAQALAVPPEPTTSTACAAVHPIRRGSETVGYLRLAPPSGREFSTTEKRLLAACCSQAGQLLALIAREQVLRSRESDLIDRSVALRRSRLHLLDAGRIERRRVERDLHDGAQQQLIALGLSIQLARQLGARSPHRSAEVLRQAAELARDTGHELGRLTDSLYPAVLREGSLAGALDRVAVRCGVPVTIEVDPPDADRLLDADSRDALFFVVSEAVQNAVKHGRADRIIIDIRLSAGALVLRIIDHGIGFDPVLARPGAGMRNIGDRLADIGADLDVASVSGGGTTLTVSLPLGTFRARASS